MSIYSGAKFNYLSNFPAATLEFLKLISITMLEIQNYVNLRILESNLEEKKGAR